MPSRLQRLRHRAGVRSEICETCGRHVPATLLVECDVQGLRGAAVCPFCEGPRRFNPSYQDLRVHDDIDIPDQTEDDDLPRGADIYWRL